MFYLPDTVMKLERIREKTQEEKTTRDKTYHTYVIFKSVFFHPRLSFYPLLAMHWTESIVLLFSLCSCASAFISPAFSTISSELQQIHRKSVLHSSIGGSGDGDGNSGKPPGDKSPLDDFLDPRKAAGESENLKRAREKLSEAALPINFDDIDIGIGADSDIESDIETEAMDSNNEFSTGGGKLNILSNATSYANNPYLNVVAKLSPSDLISKFTSTAHPRVQDAVRNTILGLIGSFPKMAFESTTITTGERLASLMFQLQMTGYLFKNAEYRLSLSQSLGMTGDSVGKGQSKFLLKGDEDDEEEEESLSAGEVKGKIKISYSRPNFGGASDGDRGNDTGIEPSMEVEVDAAAYMAELRDEVKKLREDLSLTRKNNEEAIRKDLLLYIKTLPPKELQTLTNTMSPEVMAAMKGLVNVVMSGIGEGKIDRNTVTEQSGEAMAQLCMWQLVVGYNLRELEVRQEMKNALQSAKVTNADGNLDNELGNQEMGSFE